MCQLSSSFDFRVECRLNCRWNNWTEIRKKRCLQHRKFIVQPNTMCSSIPMNSFGFLVGRRIIMQLMSAFVFHRIVRISRGYTNDKVQKRCSYDNIRGGSSMCSCVFVNSRFHLISIAWDTIVEKVEREREREIENVWRERESQVWMSNECA